MSRSPIVILSQDIGMKPVVACLISMVLTYCSYASAGCVDTFVETVDTHAVGAIFSATQRTLVTCQRKCIDVPKCVGIDYNNGTGGCWLHLNAQLMATTLTTMQEVNNYNLTHRCVDVCVKAFAEQLDMHAPNGIPSALPAGLSGASGCKDLCYVTSGCVAVDFNNGTKDCWLHKDISDLDGVKPLDSVDFYRLTDICEGDVTTTTSTTTITTTTTKNLLHQRTPQTRSTAGQQPMASFLSPRMSLRPLLAAGLVFGSRWAWSR